MHPLWRGSDGEAAQGGEEFLFDGFVVLDGFGEGHIDHFVVLDAYHHVALVFHEGVDGRGAQTRGQNAVVGCGRAAKEPFSEES